MNFSRIGNQFVTRCKFSSSTHLRSVKSQTGLLSVSTRLVDHFLDLLVDRAAERQVVDLVFDTEELLQRVQFVERVDAYALSSGGLLELRMKRMGVILSLLR